MKKLLFLIITILSSFFYYGCEKDISTEDHSVITYYVAIKMNGESTMLLPKGETFVDPGFTATEKGVDAVSKVSIEGTVEDDYGIYEIVYSAINVDGYLSSVTRTVIIYDPNSPEVNLTGSYDGVRVGRGGGTVQIKKLGPGIFSVSDMFGGYYEVVADYGEAYRLKGLIMLNSDYTITGLKNDSPWGPWDILNGVYDPDAKMLSYRVFQDGFYFDVTLTKK